MRAAGSGRTRCGPRPGWLAGSGRVRHRVGANMRRGPRPASADARPAGWAIRP